MLYELAIYSAKVALCLAAFYLYFKWLLSRETFHAVNRAVVLLSVAASFALPVFTITVYREIAAEPFTAPAVVAESDFTASAPVIYTPQTPWWQTALGILFVAGAAAYLLRTAVSLAQIWRIIRSGRREESEGLTVVYVAGPTVPFSWGRYVVISEEDAAANGEVILAHERAHARLHHSWDLLFFDVAATMQWFNPAMWLLRRELAAIHEYEADAAVLASGVEARQYQLLLISKAAGRRWYSVANSFNHSKLKNRITMMLRKKSSRWAAARTALLLPMVGVALGAFARTAYVVVPSDKVNENSAIVQPADTIVGANGGIKIVPADKEALKNPLYIFNGREISAEEFKTLNVGKSAKVNIFKGDKAVEKYGERGREGVVEIVSDDVATGNPRQNGTWVTVTENKSVTVSTSKPDGQSGNAMIVGLDDVPPFALTTVYILNGREISAEEFRNLDTAGKKVSISVSKDAATCAKYGDCEGVVTITTQDDGGDIAASGNVEGVSTDAAAGAVTQTNTTRVENRNIVLRGGRWHGAMPAEWLYVIDGEPVPAEKVREQRRIISMRLLTNDKAAAKYGERYRAGVAEITTRANKSQNSLTPIEKDEIIAELEKTKADVRIEADRIVAEADKFVDEAENERQKAVEAAAKSGTRAEKRAVKAADRFVASAKKQQKQVTAAAEKMVEDVVTSADETIAEIEKTAE